MSEAVRTGVAATAMQTQATFGVAGVQMSVSAFDDNVERMGAYLNHIRTRFPWVRMVLFSELARSAPRHEKAEPLPGPTETRLRELARADRAVADPRLAVRKSGSRLTGELVYNTTPVIDPQGEVIARFRKMFPFRPYERDVVGGKDFCVFDVPGAGRFGVSICYDMWFPETTRTLVAMGAEVILHPTMTDTIDREVELSIARARRCTNQVYFFDINGVGDGGVGRSIVCDPSGYVLHQADGGAEIMPIEVDFARVRRERERGLRSNLGPAAEEFSRPRLRVRCVPPRQRRPTLTCMAWEPLTKPD